MSKSSSANILAVILAVFFPPLGVAVHQGITKEFWICLLLTIFFFLPGLIYAMIVILR